VSHLKIKIPSKNMREKPTNTPIFLPLDSCTEHFSNPVAR
jgi:hypothetical protein